MKKFLIGMILSLALALSACNTANVKVSTKYTDPDTGAVVLIVYDDGDFEGFIEYANPDTGLITKVRYERDAVTGSITYINPETGLETTIEIGGGIDNTERG